MGHEIVWLARYEALKVELRTMILIYLVSLLMHTSLARYSFTLGVCVRPIFMKI